ncbi:MAG: type II toxin-antitoxin system PemK/MazF family toxin [Acidimicrobiia bacterium]|nr:type II toxin-antitoxin system PemK/MazF family toxin [Acidimicrobiia bacterium]
MVKRGEVWWYEPPYAKPRPHLVLTRDELVPVLSDILAIPATRTRRDIPTEVPVDGDDGMPAPSVLTADNLGLVERGYLTRRITALSPLRMSEVCDAVAIATGCS